MQLTRYTDYGLRVLMYLAVNADRIVTIGEIADGHGISRAHLMKVVHGLGQQGYVETIRGRKGGLRLALPPDEISIGDVVRDSEENLALTECLSGSSGLCAIDGVCGLPDILEEALDALLGALDRYTLADAIRRRKGRLNKILAAPRRRA